MPGSILRSAECAERRTARKQATLRISRGVPARGEKDCTPHEKGVQQNPRRSPTPPLSGPTARGAGSSRRPGPPTAGTSRRARARATPREVPTLGAGAYPPLWHASGYDSTTALRTCGVRRLTFALGKNLMARSCQNASQPRTWLPKRCGKAARETTLAANFTRWQPRPVAA